jgi:hypothetical protein
MVEDISNNTEVDLHLNEPREHVKVMREKYPDRDLTEYFTNYSIDMSEDSINTFYGGVVKFDDINSNFDIDRSKKHVERVEDRLSWLLEFEYTPKELKEKTDEFLEEFKENIPKSGKEWNVVVDRWVKIVRPLVDDLRDRNK